ncbi:MAG: amidoligase family protein [Moheibacter sp.]
MSTQEILNSNLTKTAKAKMLYDLGHTRRQVADWLMNGNYGFAHNVWRKWNESESSNIVNLPFEFNFNRTFGIELETYDANIDRLIIECRNMGIQIAEEGYNHTTRNHWKIVTDSSISGRNGREIVSPVLKGTDGLEQIKKVCLALNRAGAKVNKSCGFHLHLGVQDYTLENFKSLFKSHIRTESEFDAIVPESRRQNQNRFCKSLTSIRSIRTKIDGARSLNYLRDIFNTRYLKLNFQSYQKYGTVEFRQHSGTITYSKIKNWILICGRMVDYCKQNGLTNNLNSFLNESLQDYVSDRAADLVA